jgi:hypothetical protein
MRRAARLLELQTIDLALDTARKRVRAIDGLLVESDALRAARQAAERSRSRLAQLHTRSKDLELQSTALDEKIKSVEDRLYSGAIKNPKELADLQKDAAALRRHKTELDDTLLGVLDEMEQAERERGERQVELAQVEAAWQRDQAALSGERAQLSERIAASDAERSALRADTPLDDLAVYDRLRAQKHGQAVARLEDGVCGACGVQPSANKMAHLQRDDALIACGNCERILVVL